MKKYTAYIVDDELNNVEVLKHFITQYCPTLQILGHSLTRGDAITQLTELNPDIVFMDIVLDQGSGFDVLENIQLNNSQLIFVTAYDDFAIKAFKFNAVDYVLKPIDISELVSAVERAKARLQDKLTINNVQIENLMKSLTTENVTQEIIAIPTIENIEFIEVASIVHCASEGKYTTFFINDGSKLVSSRNIGEYENLLDEKTFFRIHKSYIVNLKYVKSIDKAAGKYCRLKDGKALPVAKRRLESLSRFLKLKN